MPGELKMEPIGCQEIRPGRSGREQRCAIDYGIPMLARGGGDVSQEVRAPASDVPDRHVFAFLGRVRDEHEVHVFDARDRVDDVGVVLREPLLRNQRLCPDRPTDGFPGETVEARGFVAAVARMAVEGFFRAAVARANPFAEEALNALPGASNRESERPQRQDDEVGLEFPDLALRECRAGGGNSREPGLRHRNRFVRLSRQDFADNTRPGLALDEAALGVGVAEDEDMHRAKCYRQATEAGRDRTGGRLIPWQLL